MTKHKIIDELISLDFDEISSLEKSFSKLKSNQDILYQANCIIFASSSIDHKERLFLLKKVEKISLENNIPFCVAHNLTLSIKVSKELGQHKKLVKQSHKAINMWKSILNQPLAINGLIFSYIDLGLIFSDYEINSLALKYLEKAESLISECEDDYSPFSKLYVAYAMVYSRLNNYKKTNEYYNKVIEAAESKKDVLTLIPVLVNMAGDLVKNKDYKQAQIKIEKALKISDKNKDNIYKPYIYNTLGRIYFYSNQIRKSEKYLNMALKAFDKMNVDKMIPENMFYLSEIHFKQKKYSNAIDLLGRALNKSKKINNLELNVKILKKISVIYRRNKDKTLYLSTIDKLNKALEKQVESKNKLFSDTNLNALKHLSEEFDLSLLKQNKLKLKLDIESKKRKLTTDALISVSEREFLEKVVDRLSVRHLENKKIIQLCRHRMRHTKDWNIFMKLFNDIHPYFNKYIIKKCPTITESELRVCNLIKMGFSSLEIADILSISKRGIEQHRYRIRKKLDLQTDLTIFIQSL